MKTDTNSLLANLTREQRRAMKAEGLTPTARLAVANAIGAAISKILAAQAAKPSKEDLARDPLWKWSWASGGYNQVRAKTREEALEKGNAMCNLIVNERTLVVVENENEFWRSYPIFD